MKLDVIFLLLFIIPILIPGIIYYAKYKNDLSKIRGKEGIKGIVEKVEFIGSLGTGFYKSNSEFYTLTVKLEDGRLIKTNIKRNVARLGRNRKYSWIPSNNDSITIYDNHDGSYENDYEIRFKKIVIPRIIIIYSVLVIMFVLQVFIVSFT